MVRYQQETIMMNADYLFVVSRFITSLDCNFWCTVAFASYHHKCCIYTTLSIISLLLLFCPNRLHAVRQQQATTVILSDFELIRLQFHTSLVTVGVVYLSYRTIEIPLFIQFVCYSEEIESL